MQWLMCILQGSPMQSYMDENAFLGVTAALWEADRVMDTAELDCVDIMR